MTAPENAPLTAPAAARALLDAVEAGESVVLLETILDPVDARRGNRLLVTRDAVRGSLGDAGLDGEARSLALRVLDEPEAAEQGLHELTDARGREVRVYLELHHPRPELVIVGAGHIARPLCTIGALLGFRVAVLDDRPDFATRERFPEAEAVVEVDFDDPFAEVPIGRLTHLVLVTRGHKYDYECLRRLLRVDPRPAYVGMIGSRRRVRATYAQLLEEGIPRERIAAVHAPVGLDLGAETPAEIAVSVASEIVLRWGGGSGRPHRDRERVLERFFPPDDEAERAPDEDDPGGASG